jgi:hypothetical protein
MKLYFPPRPCRTRRTIIIIILVQFRRATPAQPPNLVAASVITLSPSNPPPDKTCPPHDRFNYSKSLSHQRFTSGKTGN